MLAKPLKLLDATAGRPRLDRYELIAALASGGMATVYLGRVAGAGGFQRFVAIKQLHPHLAHEAEFVRMFLDEGRLAAGIHHPNVVPILDIGTSEAGYYLVMEYVEGETLATLRSAAKSVDHTGLQHRIAMRTALDSLRGLHAAHELRDDQNELLGLVHRDVSPQNILVGVDGASRITDFGVARAASRLTSSRAGELKGKIAYMAPEQVLGENLDRRADLFAMGIVIWELLTNRHLFRSDSDAATMRAVLDAPIPDLTTAAPGVPAPVAKIVSWALSRQRDARPANCAELADALERAAQRTIGVATPADVAAYMEHLAGPALSERRIAVREWLVESAGGGSSSMASLPSTDSATLLTPITSTRKPDQELSSPRSANVVRVETAPPPAPPASTGKRLLTVVVVALLACAGVAAFLLRPKPETPASTTVATPRTTTSAPPIDSAPPAAKVTASAAPEASPSATASAASSATAAPTTTAASTAGTKGHGTGPATAKPKTGGDDDMSANPYR